MVLSFRADASGQTASVDPEIRKIYGRFDKILWDFTNITLDFPPNSQKPWFKCKKLLIKTTKCDSCLFLHKMCCKMIWKLRFEKSYGSWLPDGPNSLRFYLTVWDMASMLSSCWIIIFFHVLSSLWSGENQHWNCKTSTAGIKYSKILIKSLKVHIFALN